MKISKDQPLIIGDDYLISLLSQVKQRQLVIDYRDIISKTCPICESPLYLMYVDELGKTIFWECRGVCTKCQKSTCTYTETTDLNGTPIKENREQSTFIF